MRYINDCRFVGQIANPIKKEKTVTGQTYVYIALEIEAATNANSTENNYHQKIHIMCFHKHIIDYLDRVKAKQGNLAIVFGFVSVFRDEVKGKPIIMNAINANAVYIVKTKPDN